MTDERKCAIARAGGLCLALATFALIAWVLGWADYLFGVDGMQRLSAVVAENLPLALIAYAAFVVVGGTVLALPGALFGLAAGILFGPWLGTAICALSATVAAVLSFLAGRTFLRDAVKPLVMRNDHLRLWLFEDTGRTAVLMLLVTRMVPVFPFNLQNYAYGITDVKLPTYTWCTFLFMLPGTALYAFAGAGLVNETERALYLGITAALAIAAVLAAVMLRRRTGQG